MFFSLEIGLSLIAVLLLIPCLVLLVECLMSILPLNESLETHLENQPSFKILIPAHNEETVIEETLKSLLLQVNSPDEIIVIADNCTDRTAEIARKFEITVLERQDSEKRGKGYAIDYGIKFLNGKPPEIVIILDADCLMEPQTLGYLVQLSYAQQKPIQSTYLMETDLDPMLRDKISAFAILMKNFVRPYGLARLNSPCLLNGSGMAFPWSIISQVNLANNKTVDDMQLSVDLAIAGYAPSYCPQGKVIGRLMQQDQAQSQRSRWEHGHLSLILSQTPRLLLASLKQRRLDLLALALELSVPPLSLLVMFWGLGMSIMVTAGLLGISWLPSILLGIGGICLITAIVTGWAKFGREEISGWALISIPFYLLWKIPLYVTFLVRPQSKWVKTERD
ncbi:glycosyltransferase family 2 protein [Crocosphaera sp. UHCC 0190]|uniref:glycosyltransferase family 2 protein n=1 Tax=Crocosphaera sp. UHCC 0190 TaxID=3110246 RepID=UPI002B213397|nr:glycosyltransferase family 2 protein [Crocosphaera sp. UHCC 0190]MEA5511642.1 glycosyltransferase family 2 protein [Crocosphaera sp. UHCC 0190]